MNVHIFEFTNVKLNNL